MEQRQLALIGGILLISLAGLLKWYADYKPNGSTGPVVQEYLIPDTIIDDISQTAFDQNGWRDYTLEATKASHFQSQNKAQFVSPTITFFDTNELRWTAQADTGETNDNGDTLTLVGSVSFSQHNTARDPITLTTEQVQISPKLQTAETDHPVSIQQGNHQTKATGLRIDMTAGKITLLSKVTSHYEPRKKQ